MHSKIREAVERVGPDRVLCGSDTRSIIRRWELAKVRASGLPMGSTDRVLGENGRALFFGEDAHGRRVTTSVMECRAERPSGEPELSSHRGVSFQPSHH